MGARFECCHQVCPDPVARRRAAQNRGRGPPPWHPDAAGRGWRWKWQGLEGDDDFEDNLADDEAGFRAACGLLAAGLEADAPPKPKEGGGVLGFLGSCSRRHAGQGVAPSLRPGPGTRQLLLLLPSPVLGALGYGLPEDLEERAVHEDVRGQAVLDLALPEEPARFLRAATGRKSRRSQRKRKW